MISRSMIQFALRVIGFVAFLITALWMIVQPGFEPLVTLVTGIGALVGSFLVSEGSIEINDHDEHRNRMRLLGKVRSFWVEGVLKNSLHGAAMLELGLEYRSSAVEHPWKMMLRRTGMSPAPILPGTRILDVFRNAQGTLLILGEPGAGKTTTVLELARELLEQADNDSEAPIPVVFNLSSWAIERQTISEWLVEELNQKYQVPRQVAVKWVSGRYLTCLLDGLDEVDERYRRDCIDAINRYRTEQGVDIAVCCRTQDYDVTHTKLNFESAVSIQPLSDEQIVTYFQSYGTRLAVAKMMIQADEDLRKLARTPLFLSIIALAYLDQPQQEAYVGASNATERRRHLFDVYVEQMIRRRGDTNRYATADTLHWLHWLATQLFDRSQTIFQIEQLRYDWLPPSISEWTYQALVAILALPLVAIATGTANAITIELLRNGEIGFNLPFFVATVFAMGAIVWFGANRLFGRAASVVVGAAVSIAVMVASAEFLSAASAVLIGLFAGVMVGATYKQIGSISTRNRESILDGMRQVYLIEAFSWSWGSAYRGARGGLAVSVVFALTGAAIATISLDLGAGLIIGLAIFMGVLLSLVAGAGLRGREIETRTIPNQGIKRSARTAFLAAIGAGVAVGVSFGAAGIVLFGTQMGMVTMLLYFLFGMSIGALAYGGYACLQHIALRYLLYRTGCIPRNYAAFLDYTSDCLLTRKVGGGYIFVHRYLLEYFAKDVVA